MNIEKHKNRRKLNNYEILGSTTVMYTHKGEEILIDTEDLEKVKHLTWNLNKEGYARSEYGTKTKRIRHLMHRFIMNPPKDKLIDHINRNASDNRKTNLRICTHIENNKNTKVRKDNKSGLKGVCYDTREKKWRAKITKNKKTIELGHFKNKENAIQTRLEAEKIYFDKYSRQEYMGGKLY